MAFDNGYTYRRNITIDNTKVSGSADLTNYPVLINGTYTYLKTTANGGKVESASGYDIIFTSDEAGSTILDFERVNWGASTGIVEYHVRIPTVKYNADTTFYMFYGKSGVTTDTQNKTGTWHSNYKAVYHCNESSGNLTDSTSNEKTFTAEPTLSYSQSSQIGLGINTGANGYFKRSTSIADFTGDNEVTMDIVFKLNNTTTNGMVMFHSNGGYIFIRNDNTSSRFQVYAGGTYYNSTVASAVSAGNTYHYVGKFVKGDKIYFYRNGGSPSSTACGAGNLTETSDEVRIGSYYNTQKGDITITEARMLNIGLTDGWVTTEYNNFFGIATFYAVGDEEEAGSGTLTYKSILPAFRRRTL
jgi:hypothetical protein